MARITVEDCLRRVPNHFDLVVLAARRARDLSAGQRPRVRRDNDKNTILALREVASGAVGAGEAAERCLEALVAPPVRRAEAADAAWLLEEVTIGEEEDDEDGTAASG